MVPLTGLSRGGGLWSHSLLYQEGRFGDINLFVFDDEIEMKNRSTIQTLTFVQTNPDHLYMKLVHVHPQFRFEKIGSLSKC